MKIETKFRRIQDDFTLEGNKLYQDIAAMEPQAVTQFIPLTWHKAVDFVVYDDRGNSWIDLTSGIFVANAGHSNPKVKQAIKDQVDADLLFAYNYPTEIKYKFLSKLLAVSPKYFDRVMLLNSGSEAMDSVYKLVKLYGKQQGKKYIITFKGNYHGRGLSNELIAGDKERAAWSSVPDPDVIFLDFPYNDTDAFDPSLLPPPDQIAGFIIETFQGWGAWFYPSGFVNAIHQLAKQHGALVCFDEMQAGFYRMGPIYGYMTYGEEIQPDIIALGKGISSSLPISAVLSREEIVDIDPKADLHGTHSANAVACAAALASVEFLSDPAEIAKREQTMAVFTTELLKLKGQGKVTRVNVRGMIAALIFETPADASRVIDICIRHGVLPVCTNKTSIKIAPPLTITEEAIYEFIQVMADAINDRIS